MKNRRIYKLIALIIALVLLLAACGEKEERKEKKGSTAVLALQMQLPSSLDPLSAEYKSVKDALSLCYEPLFRLDGDMNPKGILSSGMTVSEDCTEAIITLKDNVLWHDGVKFTSSDVVHTINVLKENASSPYHECVKYIAEVQAIEPLTVKIVLSRTFGQINYSLTFPIVPSHNIEIEENIVGTGPYLFENYATATMLTLKKNEKWHGGDVNIETVDISVIRDEDAATYSFNSGGINAITGYAFDLNNSVPKTNSRMTQYSSLQYEFMAFNHKSSVFSNASVRVAVSSAIDRSAIVKEAYNGAAYEVNTPIHPEARDMSGASRGSQYNLSNAEEMLFLEGYSLNEATGVLYNEKEKALSFTLLVNKENSQRVKTANMLCAQLFLAGVEAKVVETDFETYISRIERGEYDAYLGGVSFLNLYDYEFLLSEQSMANKSGYSSEYMRAALDAISRSSGKDALLASLISFDEVFLKEQPVCGIVFCNDILITAQNVMGKLLPNPGSPYANVYGWSVRR